MKGRDTSLPTWVDKLRSYRHTNASDCMVIRCLEEIPDSVSFNLNSDLPADSSLVSRESSVEGRGIQLTVMG